MVDEEASVEAVRISDPFGIMVGSWYGADVRPSRLYRVVGGTTTGKTYRPERREDR